MLPSQELIQDILGPQATGIGLEGRFIIWDVDEGGEWHNPTKGHNLPMYSWGAIASQCIGLGNTAYKVSSAYLEFYNTASPGVPAPVPTFDRSGGLNYYSAIAPPGDYLRVPLLASPTVTVSPGYAAYFSGTQGNVLTFLAQTVGTAGVLGVPFSQGVNSVVIGCALVATPSPNDRTADVILSRGYLPVINQKAKLSNSQVGLTWQFSLL